MSANSYIEWPENEIPLPFVDHQGTLEHSTIQTQGTGAVNRRARFTNLYSVLQIEWRLTTTQWLAMQDFVEVDLSNGIAQFKIDLRYPNNSLLTTYAVRLMPEYEATNLDGIWRVAGALELVREFPGPAGMFLVAPETSGGDPLVFVVEGSVPFILLSL